jgi:hypothetical protein
MFTFTKKEIYKNYLNITEEILDEITAKEIRQKGRGERGFLSAPLLCMRVSYFKAELLIYGV